MKKSNEDQLAAAQDENTSKGAGGKVGQRDFARLFNDTPYGQILVVLRTNEENAPEISISVQLADASDCSAVMEFDSNGEGWEAAQSLLENISKDAVIYMLKDMEMAIKNDVSEQNVTH